MKTLPGQELAESDYAELLKAIDELIWKMVYEPIVDLVRPALPKVLKPSLEPRKMQKETARELHNDAGEDALRKALKDGAVQMVKDKSGGGVTFTVAKPARLVSDGLRAFGATLDKRTGAWKCPAAKVPAWVRQEAAAYALKAKAVHDQVKGLIDDLGAKVDALVDGANLSKAADHAISEVADGWKDGAKKLEVIPDLGPAGQSALAAGFKRTRGINIKSPGSKVGMVSVLEESTKREVKVWAKEALTRLRDQVDDNAIQGYRAEGLADRIRNEYGVSKSRSSLIARQETNNFMAAYRAARAADAGLKRYKWFCVRDSRARKDHVALHGKIFRYDTPPVTDTRTSARNSPGTDFRCRCIDLPVIE